MTRSLPAIAALALFAVPVAACSGHFGDDDEDHGPGIAATGSGGTRQWAVSGIEALDTAAAGDVEVHVGPAFSLTATGNPDALDKIKVSQHDHTLTIGWRQGVHWSGDAKLHFVLTLPKISGVGIGGSGSITIDRVEGHDFEGDIGGSGTLAVQGMKVGKASFNIGGSGDVTAAGTADKLDVSIGGSGKVKAEPLTAATADVSIAGAGDVAATVTRHADISIMGSGDVTIKGGAKCSVTKMGGGTVNCG